MKKKTKQKVCLALAVILIVAMVLPLLVSVVG